MREKVRGRSGEMKKCEAGLVAGQGSVRARGDFSKRARPMCKHTSNGRRQYACRCRLTSVGALAGVSLGHGKRAPGENGSTESPYLRLDSIGRPEEERAPAARSGMRVFTLGRAIDETLLFRARFSVFLALFGDAAGAPWDP